MNRKEAKQLIEIKNQEIYPYGIVDNVDEVIDKIYDEFEKDLKDINNQVLKLKKQLASNHHIEYSCSFCKPVNELKEFKFTSCNDCRNKIDGVFQEVCGNCKRFYGCYFEAKEV